MADNGTTIYFDAHQRAYIELFPHLGYSPTSRDALDRWLEEVQDVNLDEFKAAVETVENSDRELDVILEEAGSVDEFLEHSEGLNQ